MKGVSVFLHDFWLVTLDDQQPVQEMIILTFISLKLPITFDFYITQTPYHLVCQQRGQGSIHHISVIDLKDKKDYMLRMNSLLKIQDLGVERSIWTQLNK